MNVADSTGDFQESAPVSGVRVEQLDEDEDEEEEEEEEEPGMKTSGCPFSRGGMGGQYA